MNWIYWIPTIAFLLHVCEEFGRFPSWASRHFARTSTPWYVYSHIILVVIFVCTSWLASTASADSIWPLGAITLQWIIGFNAIFHIVVTIWYREYSPGVVTGCAIVLPATWIVFNRTTLSTGEMGGTLIIGLVVSLIVIASLWVDFGIDWRGRRG